MSFSRAVLCLWVSIVALGAARAGFAQETGSISGTVTDPSGAVIPGVTITITNAAGLTQTVTADEQGNYSVPKLAPGTYRASISLHGFKEFRSAEIVLAAGQEARLDISLQPAAESATVNVQGQKAAEVETETAQISGTITQKEVVSIGLNGRNFTQLITLAPGVSNQTNQDEALVGVKGSVRYSVNGGRVEYNTFDVDGGDVLNAGINGNQSVLIVYPSLDAIADVRVLTSNYGAIYGRSASGTFLVTTKSGTGSFHGDGYEFIRNEYFNARNFFDQTTKAPLYRRNDFGFTLGGPLFIPKLYNTKKDKTFFFFSEEARLERSPQDFNQAVPSMGERTGNFSDVCPFAQPMEQVLFLRSSFPDCPRKSPADVSGFDQTYPGNQVPIDPNAQAILNTGVIPPPTSTVGCNSTIDSCYNNVVSPPTYWREELFRIDHNFTQGLHATFRYIHDAWDTTTATPQWPFVQNSFPTIENRFVGPGLSLLARITQIASATFVNEVTVGYTTDHISLTDINGPGGTFRRPAGLTVGALFNNGFGGKIPGIIVSGSNLAYGGFGFAADPSYEPWKHSNPTVIIRDDASKTIGKHTFQFGAHFVLAHRSEVNNAAGANTGDVQGVLNFTNETNINTSFNAFADLLVGTVRAFQQDSAQRKYYNSYQIYEPYFQDDWKISPRLTLNLGLRMSLFGLWHEKYKTAFNWDPRAFNPANALAVEPSFPLIGVLLDPTTQQPISLNLNNLDPRITNGIVRCGFNGVPEGCMNDHLVNPAPRIGFAFDPRGNGRTSIRGGYGIFYHHGTGNEANTGSLEGSPPLVLDMTQTLPPSYEAIGRGGFAYPLNVTAIPTRVMWPYVQQWSLSAQHEIHNTVFSAAYVGSKGTHLTAALQVNQLTPLAASQNPFLPGQPLTTAICNTFSGTTFTINNTLIPTSDPAFVNLEAACFGAPASLAGQAPKAFPDPNSLRTFAPGYGRIFSLQNIADSNYNGFQFTIRRTQGPLYLDLAYSYSHSIDDSSDRFDATFVNSADLKSNRGSSNFDQRHLLNIGYVYDLSDFGHKLARLWKWEKGPTNVGENRPAGGAAPAVSDPPPAGSKSSWIERKLLEGWQLSGVTTFQSGTPFSVINGASAATGISVLDNAGVANGIGAGSYPDIIDDPRGPAPKGSDNSKSFGPVLGNPAAFGAPTGLTFGNAGRNSFNNPRRLNFDVALLKRFHLAEAKDLELRGEAFNIFNHTQFRIYNPDRGNTGTNVITCYAGANASAGNPSCLPGNSFLHPVDAHRPRTIQFGIKMFF